MNCFQLIKTVLDEAYQAIPGDDASKDAAINAAFTELSGDYRHLLAHGSFDYSNPCKRFAYIYRYTTSHANLVYQVIRLSTVVPPLFEGPRVSIACIGGGPGSDFLGVLKYCLVYSKSPELKAMILDRDPAWSESWSDVDDKLGAAFRMSTICHPIDVTNPSSWSTFTKHFQADLFTLIYFMSEVYALHEAAQPYFDALFAGMRRGAIVLFIDNNSDPFKNWFDSLAASQGVSIVDQYEGDMQMPFSEEKTDLGIYYTKFGPPKLTANVAYRTAVKS